MNDTDKELEQMLSLLIQLKALAADVLNKKGPKWKGQQDLLLRLDRMGRLERDLREILTYVDEPVTQKG
jgi:hypothetical protein